MKSLGFVLAGVLLFCPISGVFAADGAVDFGNYSCNLLVQKAWQSFMAQDFNAASAYANKVVELYSGRARAMQNSLTDYPSGSKDKIFSYWALNDVGTALFILAESYRKEGQLEESVKVYQKIIDEYAYAQCWDPKGWFWRPAEAAAQGRASLEEKHLAKGW